MHSIPTTPCKKHIKSLANLAIAAFIVSLSLAATANPLDKARKAAEALKSVGVGGSPAGTTALPAGFIAVSSSGMNWDSAQAFCKQQGGRLPLIAGRDRLSNDPPPPNGTPVDGFGSIGGRWPAGLPIGRYWTGVVSASSSNSSWVMSYYDNTSRILFGDNRAGNNTLSAACVR